MILNHINNKMPIYKDCTFGELLILGGASLITMGITFSLISRLLLGYTWIGFALTILLLVPTIRLLTGRLQRVKFGKPYGYYQQLFIKRLSQFSFLQSILPMAFVQREGKWSVRRGL
jgi:conjugative transfer region protein (TIGR03750 family)